MPTIMTHAAVGLGLGRLFATRPLPPLFWGLAAMLPMVPDLDVIGLRLGVPYGDSFGHRGFSHSLAFALGAAAVAAAFTFKRFGVSWSALFGFFFVITASHGILDALTNGGLGVAFFWPVDDTRRFFPWTPVQVSPIGAGFFSQAGARTMLSEALWIWLPLAVLVGTVEVCRAIRAVRRRKRMSAGSRF